MFALTLAPLAAVFLPQQPEAPPRTHEPPPFEQVFGAGAVVQENVGSNLRLNRDTTTQWQNEYSIAIDPNDPDVVLASANDYRIGRPVLGRYSSVDGGRTVVADGILPLAGWENSGDPAVGFDGFGTGYIIGLHFNRSPLRGALFVHRTTDGGRTFEAPIVAYGQNDLPDKPLLAIDQRTAGTFAGSLYITFTQFFAAPGGLQCIRSRDGGRTWSAGVRFGDGQGTSPAIGPDGELYVSWLEGNSIRCNASLDGGATFRGVRTVAPIQIIPGGLPGTAFRAFSFPTTGVDRSHGPHRGRVHVCWPSIDAGSTEIFAAYSDDSGQSWSRPVRVNDVATGEQFFQWMAVDNTGAVFVCWQDRRNDPANISHECYASASYDGGATWITNWRVSESLNNPGSTTFLGDYNGLDAVRGRAFATWVDLRSGDQDFYTAPVTADLESSRVELSAGSGGSVDLPIKAGPSRAGSSYLLVANFTGLSGGIPIGRGVFPLNIDALTDIAVTTANQAPFVNSAGVLGAGGIPAAQPRFEIPAGLASVLVGFELGFAYVLIDPAAAEIDYASYPVVVAVRS